MKKLLAIFALAGLVALPITAAYAGGIRPAIRNLCANPQFICVPALKGETWENLFPDPTVQDIVMRINRVNIPLRAGMIIAVPTNLNNLTALSFSPFPQKMAPTDKKVIIVDPAQFAWGAYDAQGNLVHWGPASTGANFCADIGEACRTPAGAFAVYRKGGDQCKSSKFPVGVGGAPTPFCMFFHRGYALHASPQVPGYNASHGCVRIFYQDARWLNREFVDVSNEDEGRAGTEVIIKPYPA
jgi:hypothetical protein